MDHLGHAWPADGARQRLLRARFRAGPVWLGIATIRVIVDADEGKLWVSVNGRPPAWAAQAEGLRRKPLRPYVRAVYPVRVTLSPFYEILT